jgi:hypothetical protein
MIDLPLLIFDLQKKSAARVEDAIIAVTAAAGAGG